MHNPELSFHPALPQPPLYFGISSTTPPFLRTLYLPLLSPAALSPGLWELPYPQTIPCLLITLLANCRHILKTQAPLGLLVPIPAAVDNQSLQSRPAAYPYPPENRNPRRLLDNLQPTPVYHRESSPVDKLWINLRPKGRSIPSFIPRGKETPPGLAKQSARIHRRRVTHATK